MIRLVPTFNPYGSYIITKDDKPVGRLLRLELSVKAPRDLLLRDECDSLTHHWVVLPTDNRDTVWYPEGTDRIIQPPIG